MTVLSDLQDSLTNLAAAYKTATANPKPSYSVDGQSVSWESYMKSLVDQMAIVRAELAANGDPNYGPFEEVHRGAT